MIQEAAVIATQTGPAQVILAAATLVTAIGGTFVLVLTALRVKRIEVKTDHVEEKVDEGAVVQDQIHAAVNSNMTAAVKKIDEGTAELRAANDELRAAKEEISRLKADAVTEIRAELMRFREESAGPTRRGRR